MTRSAVTQAQIARVLKAAQDAGIKVARFDVTTDGVRVYTDGHEPANVSPLDQWRAKRGQG